MNEKETNIIISRIEKWYNRLSEMFVEDRQSLVAEYCWSKEPISFAKNQKKNINLSLKENHGVKNGTVLGFI